MTTLFDHQGRRQCAPAHMCNALRLRSASLELDGRQICSNCYGYGDRYGGKQRKVLSTVTVEQAKCGAKARLEILVG